MVKNKITLIEYPILITEFWYENLIAKSSFLLNKNINNLNDIIAIHDLINPRSMGIIYALGSYQSKQFEYIEDILKNPSVFNGFFEQLHKINLDVFSITEIENLLMNIFHQYLKNGIYQYLDCFFYIFKKYNWSSSLNHTSFPFYYRPLIHIFYAITLYYYTSHIIDPLWPLNYRWSVDTTSYIYKMVINKSDVNLLGLSNAIYSVHLGIYEKWISIMSDTLNMDMDHLISIIKQLNLNLPAIYDLLNNKIDQIKMVDF